MLVFLNRKHYYSINVQLVCDASLKILDVVACWPGSCHDSHIWSMSCLREKFINNENLKECWLLGDNGYPLEPWLLVPVLEPCNVSEENYNCSHRHTRGVIERCNGVLKSRFRCLDHSGGILLYNPEKVCKIIATTCILHNICISWKMPVADIHQSDDDDDQIFSSCEIESSNSNGNTIRQMLILNKFS